MSKYIFITGGVVSSIGKGIASATLGALLQARGFSIKSKKLDGYLNVDPGTMNPIQHGEVFVTKDGYEADLDLGPAETSQNHQFTEVAVFMYQPSYVQRWCPHSFMQSHFPGVLLVQHFVLRSLNTLCK